MYPQNTVDMNVDCHVLEVLEAWKAGCDGSKRWCFWEIGLSELTCESFQTFTDIFKEGKMELQSQPCRVHGQQHVTSIWRREPGIFMKGHTIVV
jgi:hypothetical protein